MLRIFQWGKSDFFASITWIDLTSNCLGIRMTHRHKIQYKLITTSYAHLLLAERMQIAVITNDRVKQEIDSCRL